MYQRIEQVRRTENQLELIKIAHCFQNGYGIQSSNLVTFEIKSL